MGRTEKLHERLDALRVEFRKLLAKELEEVAQQGHSLYFIRHSSPLHAGRSWKNADEAHLEKLEDEIVRLGEKLGDDGSPCPIRYVHEFLAAYESAGIKWWDGENKAFAKRMLKELRREMTAQQSI